MTSGSGQETLPWLGERLSFKLTDLRDHEIMAITGHLTPAMLARYTHLRADRLGARLPGGPLNRR